MRSLPSEGEGEGQLLDREGVGDALALEGVAEGAVDAQVTEGLGHVVLSSSGATPR
jgi:hypothetical protein